MPKVLAKYRILLALLAISPNVGASTGPTPGAVFLEIAVAGWSFFADTVPQLARDAAFGQWMDAHPDQCGTADEAVAQARDFLKTADEQRAREGLAAAETPMSIFDVIAIRCYTAGGYRELNRALRSRSPGGAAKVAPFRDALVSAMSKMPLFEGVAQRGVTLPDEVLDEHQVGEVVTYAAFTSCSDGDPVAGGPHLLRIRSLTGRQIAMYSTNWYEREVLFGPGRKFKVVSREQDRWKREVIELEECRDAGCP